MAETTKSEVKHLGLKGLIKESSDGSSEESSSKSGGHGGYGGGKPQDVGKKDSKPKATDKNAGSSKASSSKPSPASNQRAQPANNQVKKKK
tara:strand:+ start:10132 stop:10404 length:273 start_codon:yes stop_codon:yes gene_type:complete